MAPGYGYGPYENKVKLPLTSKEEIKNHIELQMKLMDEEYWKEAKISIYRVLPNFYPAKVFLFKEAVKEVTKHCSMNGLLLLEAMDELKQDLKKWQ